MGSAPTFRYICFVRSRVLIVGMVQSLPYSVESILSDNEKGAAFSDLNLMPMPEVLA